MCQNALGSMVFPKPCLGDLTTLSPGGKQVFPNVNVQAENGLMCWGGSRICIPENTLLTPLRLLVSAVVGIVTSPLSLVCRHTAVPGLEAHYV